MELFSDLSCYIFLHLTLSPPSSLTGTLAVDVPSWTTTLPASSTTSSRVNIFLPCTSRSHCVARSASPLCLLQGLGHSFGSSDFQTFMLPSQLLMEMDLTLDSWIFSHGSSSWPWHVFIKHCSSPDPPSWSLSAASTPYLPAAPQTRPLWSCSPLASSLPTLLGQCSVL